MCFFQSLNIIFCNALTPMFQLQVVKHVFEDRGVLGQMPEILSCCQGGGGNELKFTKL